jgi:hypothetical protein
MKARKPVVTEKQIQNYIKAQLTFHGWTIVETHGPWNRPAHEGVTDLVAGKNGYTVWIECKRPTWKPCKEENVMSRTERKERAFRQLVKDTGWAYALIRNTDEADTDIKALNIKAAANKKEGVKA